MRAGLILPHWIRPPLGFDGRGGSTQIWHRRDRLRRGQRRSPVLEWSIARQFSKRSAGREPEQARRRLDVGGEGGCPGHSQCTCARAKRHHGPAVGPNDCRSERGRFGAGEATLRPTPELLAAARKLRVSRQLHAASGFGTGSPRTCFAPVRPAAHAGAN